MKIKTKVFLSGLIFIGLIFCVGKVKAQENPSSISVPKAAPPSLATPELKIDGAVNCFDYYKFGSVQVDVNSEIGTTVPGVPMTFKATVKNDNSYPIVDGSVYVKIFRKQTDKDQTHANGFFLQDQFFAQENISLNAKESKDITFEWKVPSYALPGEYQIATFFVSAKKFNLLGLSFTDDVVGNTFNFTVKGENKTNVEFNKNTVKVNGSDYHFAAFSPRLSKDEGISIKADLVNSTKEVQVVPVTWTLYSWDGLQKQNIIDTKKETVNLQAGETKNLEYKIQNKDYPVYFLVAEADYRDTKSILDIRTVRQDVNRTRINFPAVTNYPLKQNEKNTLFVCTHNSGTADVVENNKLVFTLLDENQKEIHKYTYAGKISGAMMGLKEDFTPDKNYESFYIKSELYTDNKLVDSATMKYDCTEFTPGKCQGKGLAAQTGETTNQEKKSSFSLPIILGALLFLIGILAIVIYKKKQSSKMMMFFLMFLLSGIVFLGSTRTTEAKSVVWNTVTPGPVGALLSPYCGALSVPIFVYMTDLNLSINYSASVTNVLNNIVTDGSQVFTGATLHFIPTPFADTDIYWFGTGHDLDTPYGWWINEAGDPPVLGLTNGTNAYLETVSSTTSKCSLYLSYSVNPPPVTVSHSGTATLSCTNSNKDCAVMTPGTIATTFSFASTPSKFWNRVKYPDTNYMDGGQSMDLSTGTYFILNVPVQTITYNLTAVGVGNPPTAPIVTGPTTGSPNIGYNFTATSTDPDGNQIRYGFDWDLNGIVDQYMPASGYVNSGISQTAPYTWTINGAYTFQVLTQDSTGLSSAWTSHPITIGSVASYSCTGSVPTNASMFANDNIGLIANTLYTYSATDTATKCEYSCNGGYIWNGSSCIVSCTPNSWDCVSSPDCSNLANCGQSFPQVCATNCSISTWADCLAHGETCVNNNCPACPRNDKYKEVAP